MTLRYFQCVLAFALVLTGGALAADVAGKWKADFQTADGQKVQNVTIGEPDGIQVEMTAKREKQ